MSHEPSADLETTGPEPAMVAALRTNGATLLEIPRTLPSPMCTVWVATIRSDVRQSIGWVRQLWRPTPDGAGWTIPNTCAFGSVVEFGADTTTRQGTIPVRWYGIAIAHDRHWLVLHGPHPHPADTERQADRWVEKARAHAAALHTRNYPNRPDDRQDRRPSIT